MEPMENPKRNTPCFWFTLTFCLLPFALLVACAAPLAPTRQEQTIDGVTITLESIDQARVNTEQTFTVSLADAQGRPIDGADVYLDLTMPAMPMGTNRPIAVAEGAGRYRASTAYTMTGAWEITVVATIGDQERRAIFPREVVE